MMYETLTPWHEVVESFDPGTDPPENPFTIFLPLLAELGIPVSDALKIFTQDYYNAQCFFSSYMEVVAAFSNCFYVIHEKYDTLLKNYPFSELKKRVRSPNITRSMSASSTGSADVDRKQTETQTEEPLDNYGQTRTHSVSPYDAGANDFKNEYKDEVKNTGKKKLTTTYTGNPDHTTSSSSGSRSDTETGTETTTETTIGKAGMSMQEMLQDYALAKPIFKMIEEEIAKKIFLQVWR